MENWPIGNGALASTRELTVTRVLTLVEPPSGSVTVKMIVAVPLRLVAVVKVTSRLPPLPPNTMDPGGNRVGLLETAVTVSALDDDSASPTVNAKGPRVLFIPIVCAAMVVIVGGVLRTVN